MMFEFTLVPPGDIAYSFENTGGRLGESLDAEIKAVCSAPPKFAGRVATVILSSSAQFEDLEFLKAQQEHQPVGSLFADKNSVEALAKIPAARFLPLTAAIAAGQIVYVAFDVEAFKSRRADVKGYYFEGEAQRAAGLAQP